MLRACLYIIRRSIKNAVVSKVRRLKQPKYALALIVGLGYFGFFFGRSFIHAATMRGSRPSPTPATDEWFGWGAIVLGLLYLTLIWLFKTVDPGLLFKPAEVQYLFTAPATRRQVIHYYLLRGQPRLLLSVLFISIFGLIWIPFAHPVFAPVAAFLIFNIVFFHTTAASLIRASVFRHGMIGTRQHAAVVVIAFIVLGVVAANAAKTRLGPILHPRVIETFFREGLDSAVAYFVLYPLRALGLLLVSRDLGTFLWHLIPAAGLLALHYMWVVRSDVAFEEASQARSRVIAERMERVRKGRSPFERIRQKAHGQPFRLGHRGPTFIAVFWKNLIATTRLPVLPTLLIVAVVLAAIHVALVYGGFSRQVLLFTLTFTAGLGAFLLMAGPQMFRKDLRQDLAHLDVLKTLPLSGRQLLVGEILTPLAVVCSIQVLITLFCLSLAVSLKALALVESASVVLTVFLVYPFFAALWLLVDHAILLHFPDWVPRISQTPQGIEFLGSNIVYFLMVFFALGILLIPSILLAAVALTAIYLLLGPWVWPIAIVVVAMPVAVILAAECAVLLWFAAKKYEAFDFSTEVTTLGGTP